MSGPERDAELEAFLRRRSPLHRRFADLDHAEPPEELDRIVLGRARDAIDTPESPPVYRTVRWAMPVGLAATILIAFAVVLNVTHESRISTASADASTVSPAGVPAHDASEAAERKSDFVASSRQLRARSELKREIPEARVAADAAEPRVEDVDVTASTALASRSPAPVMAPTAPASASESRDLRASADAWLREIARLRAAGRVAEAERELEAFRRAHPSHSAVSVAEPPTR